MKSLAARNELVVAMVAMTSEGGPLARPNPRPLSADAERGSGSADGEGCCSLDPMRETDRYRLVTPYLTSIRDL